MPAAVLLAEDWLPIRRCDGVLEVATGGTLPPDALCASIQRWYPGEPVRFLPTARAQVQDAVLRLRSAEVADYMANDFARRFPEFAARSGPARWQQVGCALLVAAVVAAVALGWSAAVLAAVALLATAGLLFRSVLAAGPAYRAVPLDVTDAGLTDDELPTYTVLVAAYDERYVIADTLRSICAGDYPHDRLEVLVLLEERDVATIEAVRRAGLPECVRVVLLPPGLPQTKPRAANLGLLLARGELVVIFDADDRPAPDQLRRVANQFAVAGPELAVVQARLNFYNRAQSLLTRLFSIEYSYQWDLVYTGLSRWRLPLPLGGTSNHARTDVLLRAGGWDAWNVTEDADLGMRLAALGYELAMSESVTWEEAAARPWPWIRQRTRWLKGHLMTLAVHTRQPVQAVRRFGFSGVLTLFGIVGGSPLVAMLLPLPLLGLVCADRGIDVVGRHLPLLHPALLVWAAAVGVHLAGSIRGAARSGNGLSWAAPSLLLPYYWLLASVAGWRAAFELIRAPFQWDKTAHGEPSAEPVTAPLGNRGRLVEPESAAAPADA